MKSRTIGQKLLVAAVLASAVMVAGAGVAYRQSAGLAETLNQMSTRVELILSLDQLEQSVTTIIEIVNHSRGESLEESTNRYRRAHDQLITLLEQVAVNEYVPNAFRERAVTIMQELGEVDSLIGSAIGPEADPATVAKVHDELTTMQQEVVRWIQKTHGIFHTDLATARAGSKQPLKVVLAAMVLMIVVSILAIGYVVQRHILVPIRHLTAAVHAIVESGDLTQHIAITSDDEVGQLAANFQTMVEKLRIIPERLSATVQLLLAVVGDLQKTAAKVTEGASVVKERAGHASELTAENVLALRELAEGAHSLLESSERSAEANRQLTGGTTEVAEKAAALLEGAQQTVHAVDEVAITAADVAERLSGLDHNIAETSRALLQMDEEVGKVEGHVARARALAAESTQDAEAGSGVVEATIGGIDEIDEATNTVAQLINKLEERAQTIGNLVASIGGIAGQTNLLALNASIIAAQAGEHGSGFAVVAEEIKTLAESTRGTSEEVTRIVAAIQQETAAATHAVGTTRTSVAKGVDLGRQAREVFHRIRGSAAGTQRMVEAIATSSAQQIRSSRQVTAAIQEVKRASREMTQATRSQAERAVELHTLAERAAEHAHAVLAATRGQARGIADIAQGVDSNREMAQTIARSQQQQVSQAERVVDSTHTIWQVAEEQTVSITALQSALASLQTRSEQLGATMSQFRY